MQSPTPTYSLTFEGRPDYLYVLVDAETINAEIAMRYTAEILETCETHGSTEVLLHRDIPNVLPSGDLFFTMKSIAERLGRVRKVALLNNHLSIEKELEFAAMIANNRGGKFAVFRDLKKAEEWLMSGRAV